MYDRADIARVLDATDIVQIVGQSVQLRPKGREMVGLCPFHDDRNPSMYVSPAKQIYKCFVCGAAGDAAKFMQDYHSMSFPEAIEHLAEIAGVEIQRVDTRSQPASASSVRKSDVFDANQQAQKFFAALLHHADHGKAGREVIEQRSISDDMVQKFGLGLSPDRWDGLVSTITSKRWSLDAFLQAGLVKLRQHESGHYDTFRHRVMFPITDQLGRTIAFGARKIRDEDEPKYLNSPESPVFRKSATLYGIAQASSTIRQQNLAIITEGYTDTIACHQAGFTNAIAALGTAFTSEHAAILRRMCDRVVLLFDGDEAGSLAADRAVSVLFHEPIDVSIVALSSFGDAKDPDELLRQPDGNDAFANAIENGQDLLTFRFARLRAELETLSSARRSTRIEEELAKLVELGLHDMSPVRKSFIMRQLPGATGLDSITLADALARIKPTQRNRTTVFAHSEHEHAINPELIHRVVEGSLRADERAIGLLLVRPSLGDESDDAARVFDESRYNIDLMREIVRAMRSLDEEGESFSLANVLRELAGSNAAQFATQLAARIDRETNEDVGKLQHMWHDCMDRIRQIDITGRAEVKQTVAESLAERLARAKQRHTSTDADRTRLPRSPGSSG
ncbi:MAG: DNA primase [Phycisphaerales bacterium]